MRAFEYVSPASKEQVATLLGQNAAILAGGTDLLALMKDDVVTPARLVNIKLLSSLRGISYQPGNGLRIGALTTIAELAEARSELGAYGWLLDAASEAASPQIRNLATIGGNMCQRPRCWYFRNGMGLFPKAPDGKSMVVEGDNRYAAILGNSGPAYFVSPSTIAPVLIAYGAKIRLYSAKAAGSGVRELPLEKFFVIPKSENELEHDLRPGEMVTELIVPSPSWHVKAGYYEVRQKAAFDWPLAMAAVALEMDGNVVKSARVVLGQVAPVPWVSNEAAQELIGKSITPETAMAAANAALAGAKPLSQNKYKIALAKVAVKRAIMNCLLIGGVVGGAAQ
jgi:xanthine dehydrogenase YagS FAD-binding subunit